MLTTLALVGLLQPSATAASAGANATAASVWTSNMVVGVTGTTDSFTLRSSITLDGFATVPEKSNGADLSWSIVRGSLRRDCYWPPFGSLTCTGADTFTLLSGTDAAAVTLRLGGPTGMWSTVAFVA